MVDKNKIKKKVLICIKMIKISAETFAENCIHNIDKAKILWLKNKEKKKKLGVAKLYDLIDKENKGKFETQNLTDENIKKYKRHGSELTDDGKFVYNREDIITPIIMHCKAPETINFRTELVLKIII